MSQNSDDEHKKLLIQQRQLSNQQMELSNQMLQQILSQRMFTPINSLPTPIVPTKVPNVGTSSGNLIKQTKIGWKVSNLNFGINQDDSICLSIKLEKSAKINEIDKQKVKATLDSIKFIENLIVDNNSLNKDEKKNLVLLKQPEPKININNLNKQQNMLKIVGDVEQNNLKITDTKTVEQQDNQFKELVDNFEKLKESFNSKETQEKIFLECQKIETNFMEKILKHVNEQLNIPKIVKDVEQNLLKIKQLETKIGELTCSKAAVNAANYCTYQSVSRQINEMQINHKKQIENLRKEFEEKIKFLNCKSFLPQEINKGENKINNEKDVGFVDFFRFPIEEFKLEQYALSNGICNSIEKVNNWQLEQVNNQDNIKKDESNSELSNDFDFLEDENGKEKKKEENNEIGKEEGKDNN